MFECDRGLRGDSKKYVVGGGSRLVCGENGIPPLSTVVGDGCTLEADGLAPAGIGGLTSAGRYESTSSEPSDERGLWELCGWSGCAKLPTCGCFTGVAVSVALTSTVLNDTSVAPLDEE